MTGSPAGEDYATLSGYWEGGKVAPVVVARHPDPATWETPGFPWCTCPPEFRESRTCPTAEEPTQ